MDLHYKREVTVGSLVLLAIAVFVAGTLWLSGRSIGHRGDFVTIEFGSAGNLKQGVPVRVSGVTVGKVQRIALIEPGKVHVDITLPRNVVPKADATARIVSISTLGDAAVAFDPGVSSQPLPPGQVVPGTTEAGLTDRVAQLGDRADSVLLGIQAIASPQTATDLRETLKSMQRLMNTMSTSLPAPTEEATRTMAAMRQLTMRLDSTFASERFRQTVSNFDSLTRSTAAMTSQLTTTTARLDTLLAMIAHGEGTLGKMATDTGLYTDLRGTLQSMKELLDGIKRDPGRLTVQIKVF